MLTDAYLQHGLDALSRAHETNYFADGHRGAAILAATFFCREVAVEDGVADQIQGLIDAHWTHTPLCAPFPDQAPDPKLLDRIVTVLHDNLRGLRQAGHNVILPSLALKAFRQLPQAVTPARVAGVCNLIEAFATIDDLHLTESDDIPDLPETRDAARWILSELRRTTSAFEGRGQGWSGHLLTYGRALLDLRSLGYESLARSAEDGWKLYIKRIRMGPLDTDKPRAEHPPDMLLPHQRAYWEDRAGRPVGIGHLFKYPYGLYGLLELAQDAALRHEIVQVAYHVL